MAESSLLFHSRPLEPGASGIRLEVGPGVAGLEVIRFAIRQIAAGDTWSDATKTDEVALVLLAGQCHVSWGEPAARLGPRPSVFDGYPHAAYLPPGTAFHVTADVLCEIAECRASARRPFAPRGVRPEDCGYEIRGGGNATRQIVDIIPPAFPADRLMLCEVFTPSGNWSSYPPHKHDLDDPPEEADLEEIYYFRFRDADGFGFHRIYTRQRDDTFTVADGDLTVVREGYHPFVTAFGYDAYYLNVLAGERRSMAARDDPRYAAFRGAWPEPDPRLPIVAPPAGVLAARQR